MPSRRPSDSDTSHTSGSSSSSSRSHSRSPPPERNQYHEPSLGAAANSTLVLMHDEDDDGQENDTSSFSFSDEEEHDGLLGSSPALSSTPTPLLSPSSAFVHFLAPCLKLGAVAILSSNQLPLKFAIPALLVFSVLAAFARQVWFLLARYVKKADLAEIAIEAFAKRKGQEKSKRVIRETARWGTIVTRWLLTVLYLRASVSTLTPILPNSILLVPSHAFITIVFTLCVLPFITAKSHASRRITYTAWLSVAIYIAWLVAAIYAHNVGYLDSDAFPELSGALTSDIPLIAFAFSTVSTLQIYAGVVQPTLSRGSGGGSAGKKEKRYQAISSASLGAALLATVLTLPLVFPRIKPVGHEYREPNKLGDEPPHIHAVSSSLTALLLLSGIPPLLATAPVLPLPLPMVIRQRLSPSGGIGDGLRSLTKCLLLAVAMVVSIAVPGGYAGGKIGGVLGDLTLVVVLVGTFFLPALLHIVLHAFRRPLTILVPPSPLTNTSPTSRNPPDTLPTHRSNNSLAPTDRPSPRPNIQRSYSSSDSDDADVTTPLTRAPGMGASLQAHPFSRSRDAPSGTPRERSFKSVHIPSSSSNTHLPNNFTPPSTTTSFPPSVPPVPPDPTTETLLQRKERALQQRRFGRRIFWDVGVWLGLAPVSVGGFVWMTGRLVGRW